MDEHKRSFVDNITPQEMLRRLKENEKAYRQAQEQLEKAKHIPDDLWHKMIRL